MGQLNSMDLPESGGHTATDAPAAKTSKSLWWLWLLIVAGIVIGVWYFRGARTPSEAANPSAPAASGKGRGGAGGPGMGNFVVPVVVAAAQRGDLPVYFNGLGTVTAFNTVTVHSRVDGQLINVAFREGQYVHQGDLLVQIDPRPFQVQLEQAQGQLARDKANLSNAKITLGRDKTLLADKVIAPQDYDNQAAVVGQYDGTIVADQAAIDNAKLQLT